MRKRRTENNQQELKKVTIRVNKDLYKDFVKVVNNTFNSNVTMFLEDYMKHILYLALITPSKPDNQTPTESD